MEKPVDDKLGRMPNLTRRGFMVASGVGALAFAAACSGANKTTSGAGTNNALGLKLPSGSAAATDQYYVQAFDSTGASYKAMDFYETVYSRAPLADQFNIPLVRLSSDYTIVPGAATNWSQSSDKLSWTFHIKPGIMWSDGKELTAADYVETLRYSADPKHAWDFSWFWSGVIKNYSEAVAGKVPTSSIGVKQGSDKHTLVITTEGPIAYIPSAVLYTTPLSAAALNKYGSGSYNINPATCVTCGPYKLTKFDPTATIILSPNKKYTGPYKPPIDALVGKIYAGGDMLPRFQTGEIDTISLTPLDLKIAAKNSRTKDLHLYKNPNDFEIWYTFFDTKKAPFNNVKVRQALAHCVDRDTLVKSLLAPLATPAYGYLTPGYPFAVTDPLKPLTNYDPEKAKSLLAAAGFPGGKGFPKVTFSWWANAVSNTESVVQALTQNWNKILGINIQLQELDKTTFYDRMNKVPTQIQMGFVSYGMDYFDASNMLSVYKSGGRHNWDNSQYDGLLAKGAAESQTSKRQDIYTQAQTLLTQDAPAVFIFHLLYGYYYAPYMKGTALAKNKDGYDGIQWPGFGATSNSLQDLYVADNVGSWPRQPQTGLF
ncbi:MAG TPA: peptide ABC transporter substrate-binding protein [Mycobacteriales bacterium]|jgi:ABC-type transport system substrate-binding protein